MSPLDMRGEGDASDESLEEDGRVEDVGLHADQAAGKADTILNLQRMPCPPFG